MSLKQWQKKQNLSNVKLASLLTIHPSYLTHVYAGRRTVSPKLALKIEQLTKGEVTRLELLYGEDALYRKSIFKSVKTFFIKLKP